MARKESPNPLMADYYSRPELAKLLRRSPRTLDRWHSINIGPPRTQIGKLILYSKASVLEWLKANERNPAA